MDRKKSHYNSRVSLHEAPTKKTYAWLTDNLHGIVWEAGSYDHTFIFNFFNAPKLGLPNSTVFRKGTEKCTFMKNFFFSVVDFNTLSCPKVSQLSYSSRVCSNQNCYKLNHYAQEKVTLFYNWLFNYFLKSHECSRCNSQRKHSTANLILELEPLGYNLGRNM